MVAHKYTFEGNEIENFKYYSMTIIVSMNAFVKLQVLFNEPWNFQIF